MKNTLKSATFHILIYRGKEGYVGITYETGYVDVGNSIDDVLNHVHNGIIATFKTINENKLSEKAINQKPALNYRILFFVLPFIANIAKWLEISFFTKPFNPLLLLNS
ncbi:MAG: hypothetical protein HYW15_01290 [Candidatus Giovannonibacteria bacterium]|nr:MAG: hypothetical protein HYW15_01290 [Candidatus Giovannonibacteria bacterium]